jgi:ABC-type Fe3+/spermidine/putrescine transport system ATPase subunit
VTAVLVEGLRKRYGHSLILDWLNLELETGARLAVLGPSGSGKTTLLRLIAGLDYPDDGRILLGGIEVSRPDWLLEPHKRGVGFVFQSGALWPHMTVEANVRFGLRGTDSAAAADRVATLLQAADLAGLGRRYPDQLSAGQARRVALVRTLAPTPSLLLLDEPLVNLEPALQEQLAELIVGEAERTRATVIHVTHRDSVARLIADRRAELRDGCLV